MCERPNSGKQKGNVFMTIRYARAGVGSDGMAFFFGWLLAAGTAGRDGGGVDGGGVGNGAGGGMVGKIGCSEIIKLNLNTTLHTKPEANPEIIILAIFRIWYNID